MFSQDFLKRWFGYTRRERNGTFVLVIIVVIVALARFIFFTNTDDLNFIKDGVLASGPDNSGNHDTIILNPASSGFKQLRTFDPNSSSSEELMSLGLSERQSSTVINYRNAGGVFRTPDDFRKIYGLSEGQLDELIPYIKIDTQKPAVDSNFIKSGGWPDRGGKERRGETVAGNHKKSDAGQMTGVNTRQYYDMSEGITGDVPFELNSADSSELVKLRGIGPVLSARIVKYRKILGGFVTVDQLGEVYGIDTALVSSIASYIYVDTSLVTRIDINRSEYIDLLRHPYITPEQAGMIINYRSSAGNFSNMGQLVINRIMTGEELIRLAPYIKGFDTEE